MFNFGNQANWLLAKVYNFDRIDRSQSILAGGTAANLGDYVIVF